MRQKATSGRQEIPPVTESNLLIKSSSWVLAVSWINRLMGLLSVFILARILSPEAFGAFAILTIVVQLADVLSNFGVEQYYIQKKNATLSDLNSCWSFNLLVKLLISLTLFSTASLAANFFDKAHLTLAFQVISALPFINALNNGYIFHLKRTLAFQKFIVFSGIGQLIGSILAITIAYFSESYWALIIGLLANNVVQVLLSYIVLKSRTHLTYSQLLSSLTFGKWMLLKNIVGHTRTKFDVWFAASFFPINSIGGYSTMKDISMLPARELIGPVFQVLYSYMSNQQASNERVYTTYVSMLLIGVPCAVGLHTLAGELTYVMLGEKWVEYTPILANLAVLTLSFSAGNVVSDALISRGKVKDVFIYDSATFLLSLFALVICYQMVLSANGLSLFRAAIGIFMLLSGLLWLSFCLRLNTLRLVRALFACGLAAGIMGVSVTFTLTLPLPTIFSLIISVIIGGVVYLTFLMLLVKISFFSKEDKILLSSVSHAVIRKII